MEDKNKISENQKMIISLHNEGISFEDIAKKIELPVKLTIINYSYAIQKLNGGIPNKDSELTDKQKKGIEEALNALSDHLRKLKNLDSESTNELSYNPKDLINICKEMAEKVGVQFDEREFI